MTTAVIRSPHSWLPAVNLLAASAAVAVSVTALVVAANDDATSQPAVVASPAEPAPIEYRCDLHAGRTRC